MCWHRLQKKNWMDFGLLKIRPKCGTVRNRKTKEKEIILAEMETPTTNLGVVVEVMEVVD